MPQVFAILNGLLMQLVVMLQGGVTQAPFYGPLNFCTQ